MKKFTNIIDYAENEKRNMRELPFTPVDSLILSQLSYVNIDELLHDSQTIMIKDLLKSEYFEKMFLNIFSPQSFKRFLFALAASPRFRDIAIKYFINEVSLDATKQFSALTYILEDDSIYVAYRGTDGSIIGWKEDFLLCFGEPIPSQLEGKTYFEGIAHTFSNRKLRVGGHSKGGNIAVYSASYCPINVSQRIIGLYSHDAPGFSNVFFESEDYLRVKEVFHNTLPQSSMIGMMLGNQDNYKVTVSNSKWFMQHDPFTWQIKDADFEYADKLSPSAHYTNRTFSNWISKMTCEEREAFIETLFNVFKASDFDNLYDFAKDWKAKAPIVLKEFKHLNPDTKKMLKKIMYSFATQAMKSLPNK